MNELQIEYISIKDALKVIDKTIQEYMDDADLDAECIVAEILCTRIRSALISAQNKMKLDLQNGSLHIPIEVLQGYTDKP